jgi:hypothetical protein
MRVSRPDIASAIAAQGCARPLTNRFMREMEPLFRIAETGEYRLADASMLNQANVADALSQAMLEPVGGLMPVSASRDSIRADWRREFRYASFVSLSLRRNRRDAFDEAHGRDAIGRLTEPLWDSLGMAFTAALQASHGAFLDQLDPALAADVAFGPMVAAAYAAGYAAYGDAEGFEAMRGIVRLLPWLIPIGSPESVHGRWLVLVE